MTSTLLAACGASSSKTAANQKLNWMEEAELSTIDVSKIMDDVSFNQVNQVMEGLYTLGIKAVGKYKLVVSLERKIPYFKLLMAFPLFFPQNEQAVKKYGSKYGTASKYMVYNGPFVHKGWTGSNLSWKLVKNKYYWDKKDVKLTQINYSVQKSLSTAYNLYQAGKLDETILDAQASKQLTKSKGYTIRKVANT